MSRPRGPTTLDLIRWVAIVGLAFAAISSSINPISVISQAGFGLLVWALALRSPPDTATEEDSPGGRRVVVAVLVPLALIECLGAVLNLLRGEGDLALWYAVSLAYQLAAMVTCKRYGPDDLTLMAWVANHLAICVSAVSFMGSWLLLFLFGGSSSDWWGFAGALANVMLSVTAVFLPLSLLLAWNALALDLIRDRDRKQRAWTTLLAAQSCLLIHALRWVYGNAM